MTGAVIYAFLPQLPRFLTIIIYPLLTQHLTARDFGIFGILTAYTGIISVVRDLGLTQVLVNTYYRHRKSYMLIWRHLHGVGYFWSLLYALILVLIIHFTLPVLTGSSRLLIYLLVALPVLMENAPGLSSLYFRLSEKPLPVGISAAINGFIYVSISFLTIVYWKLGFMGWLWASFCAALFSFLFHSYILYGKRKFFPLLRIRRQYLKKYLRLGGPMMLHDYSGYLLNSSDRVVMNVLRVNINQIGLYNVAYTFGNYFALFETAMGMAATPIFLKYYSEKNYAGARQLTFLSQIIFLLASFVACLWMREVFILLVKNDELKITYPLGIVIVMGYNYKPMYQASTNILFYKEKTKAILSISFVAGLMNIILNLIFIPLYGYEAAAYTTFGCLLFMGFRGFSLKAYKEEATLNYYPVYWLFAIVFTAGGAFLLRDIPVSIKIMITLFIAVATAIGFKRFKHILT